MGNRRYQGGLQRPVGTGLVESSSLVCGCDQSLACACDHLSAFDVRGQCTACGQVHAGTVVLFTSATVGQLRAATGACRCGGEVTGTATCVEIHPVRVVLDADLNRV